MIGKLFGLDKTYVKEGVQGVPEKRAGKWGDPIGRTGRGVCRALFEEGFPSESQPGNRKRDGGVALSGPKIPLFSFGGPGRRPR